MEPCIKQIHNTFQFMQTSNGKEKLQAATHTSSCYQTTTTNQAASLTAAQNGSNPNQTEAAPQYKIKPQKHFQVGNA